MNANKLQTGSVVGAGTMGNGIAHVLALAGIDVTLIDESAEVLEAAVAKIEKNQPKNMACCWVLVKVQVTVSPGAKSMLAVAPSVVVPPLASVQLRLLRSQPSGTVSVTE